ncbi:hypothetical protein QTO34_002748 [Cnephaeus nilssonii]|uniref:Uncharacterized protein n=1 Tax=Cnephaeus nilssonii TaxID=3371016 RepID=A0AA40HSV5_CNENI|nr:hypothetical protein QTO34_002748 [Eptesicus nilssonii]
MVLFLSSVPLELVDLQMDERGEIEAMPKLLPYDGDVTCDLKASEMTNEGEVQKVLSLQPAEGEEDSNASWEPCDGEELEEDLSSQPRYEPEDSIASWEPCDGEELEEDLSSPPRCEPVSGELAAPQMDRKENLKSLPVAHYPVMDKVFINHNFVPGAELPAGGNEKYACVMCFSNDMPEGPEARTESSEDVTQ